MQRAGDALAHNSSSFIDVMTACSMYKGLVCAASKDMCAMQVAADVSTASPAWGTDALYLLIALGLAGAAWGSRSAP
jgi:hypothetical protein